MYCQAGPATMVKIKSLFLEVLRLVEVDTEIGLPIDPGLYDDEDVGL